MLNHAGLFFLVGLYVEKRRRWSACKVSRWLKFLVGGEKCVTLRGWKGPIGIVVAVATGCDGAFA